MNRYIRPFILIVLGAWLLRLSWQKWTNITLDYGRELYTPWRITCGQVLYKDIASLFGPFPPYWNALLFKIFGASIMTLALFNILLVIAITVLIYKIFSYTTDKGAAFFASAAFLSILAFKQSNTNSMDQGNFAYICPYSYSVTYALFFSLWAIAMFARHVRSGKDTWWLTIGALIGMTALCRFEIFIFLAIAIASGFILKGIMGHWPLKRFLKAGGLALGGFFVPVGIAYSYFFTQLPLSQVASRILGFNDHWIEFFHNNYYRFLTGFGDPWHNFIVMLVTAACYCLVAIAFKCLCMGIDRIEKKSQRWPGAFFVILGLVGMVQAVSWVLSDHYHGIFYGLPMVVIFMVGYLSLLLARHKQDEEKLRRILPFFVMAVWGLLMLSKVFLNVQIDFEGFVYAMPGIMLFIVFFISIVPEHFERVHAKGHFVQTLASVLLVLVFIVGLKPTVQAYQSRRFSIQSGSDKIICDLFSTQEIGGIASFLKDTDKIMGKDANFVVFPEGVMLNFLSKRVNPLPFITFISAEMISFGEQDMLSSFKGHRPEFVVLNDRFFREYSYQPGDIYPLGIRAWILANYHPVWPVHPEKGNIITVLKRSR